MPGSVAGAGALLGVLVLLGCGELRTLDIGAVPPVGSGGQQGAADAGGGGDIPDAMPAPTACPSGYADCNGRADDGCEVELATDPAHCGGCEVACSTPDCACEDGILVVRCPPGRADCNGSAADGCEVDVVTDVDHCGACDIACPGFGFEFVGSSCELGSCVPRCELGHADCDGMIETGCEGRTPC